MKKIIPFLLCLILLCGCGKKRAVEVALSSVSFDAAINYGVYNYTCNIEIKGGGMLETTILAPEAVKGTTLLYDGEKLTVNYMGLEYSPKMPISNQTANDLINQIFRSVSSSGATAEREEGQYVIKGEVAGYKYSLYVTESGLPISLSCDKANLTAEFSNVTVE